MNGILIRKSLDLEKSWNTIDTSVVDLRTKVAKLVNSVCRIPPCTLCSMIDFMTKHLLSPLHTRSNSDATRFIGYNEFNCTIWEKDVIKCKYKFCCWNSCSVKERFRFVDRACTFRVVNTLLEAAFLNEQADWKQEIKEINMFRNLGFQFILDEIRASKLSGDIFTQNNIEIDDIVYDFNINMATDDIGKNQTNHFDLDDESFFPQFNTSNFEYLDTDDEDADLTQVYVNDQDLRLNTQLIVRTARLSNLFRGIENITKKELIFNVNLNFGSESLLDASVDFLHDYITQNTGQLVTHLIGIANSILFNFYTYSRDKAPVQLTNNSVIWKLFDIERPSGLNMVVSWA